MTARQRALRAAFGALAAVTVAACSSAGPRAKPAPTAAQTDRLGFVETVVASGLTVPTALAFLPDGRILVAEKPGVVRFVEDGRVLPQPLVDVSSHVNDFHDRGLLGLAVDPGFERNGYVYLLYAYENDPADYEGPKTARLTRVTVAGGTVDPDTETVVLGRDVGASCSDLPAGADCLPTEYLSHSVGDVAFGLDGSLFVSVGDASTAARATKSALRAQRLDSLAGKILHVGPDGRGLPSNPFWDGNPDSPRSKIFAYDLRNAFRFTVGPDGVVYAGDVGWNSYEEVDEVRAGANLGWPCYEGRERTPDYGTYRVCRALYVRGPGAVEPPLFVYAHDGASASVTGGPLVDARSPLTPLRGAYVYGDFVGGRIRYLPLDGGGEPAASPRLVVADADGPVDIQLGPDGALYYLSFLTGELRRVAFGPTPRPATLSLGDLDWTSAVSAWGPVERDASNGEEAPGDGRPLTVEGETYARGLGMHAPADVRFSIPDGCTFFAAVVGVDDEIVDTGSVTFEVWLDGRRRYATGLVTARSHAERVALDLGGARELRLVVTDGGDGTATDHADWADARLACGT